MKKYALLCAVVLASPASFIYAEDAANDLAKKVLRTAAVGESSEAPVEAEEVEMKCAKCGKRISEDSIDELTRSCKSCCKCKSCCSCSSCK